MNTTHSIEIPLVHTPFSELGSQNLTAVLSKEGVVEAMLTDKDKEILINQEKLKSIKQNLADILESLDNNQSLLSRAASVWGPLPMWKKVLYGVLVSSPTLTIGFVTNIIPLFALTGVTLFTYMGGGAALDNHHQCSQNSIQRLKTSVNGLATMLETVILALDAVRVHFKEEVEKFSAENKQFAKNLKELMYQSSILENRATELKKTEEALKKRNEELNIIITKMENKALVDKSEMESYKNALQEGEEKYNTVVEEYANTRAGFQRMRLDMETQIEMLSASNDVLNQSMTGLSKTIIKNEKDRETFQQRLKDFLENKEAGFDKFLDKMHQTGEDLQKNNETHKQLLDYQSTLLESQKIFLDANQKQIDKFVEIKNIEGEKQAKVVPLKSSSPIKHIGFYARFPSKSQSKTSLLEEKKPVLKEVTKDSVKTRVTGQKMGKQNQFEDMETDVDAGYSDSELAMALN